MGLLSRIVGKPDRDDFAIIMIKVLRRTGEMRPIQYDRDDFKLRLGDNMQFFLGNAYNDYRGAARGMRNVVLSNYARSATSGSAEMPETYAAARANLLPSVRSRSYHSMQKFRFQSDGFVEIPSRPIAGHLSISLAFDSPYAITSVSEDQLTKWNISFDEALDQSMAGLGAISTGRFERLANGVYRSPWRDNYDASRLCLQELIRGLDVDGDFIAAVPDRDSLLVTGSQNVEGLEYVSQEGEAAFEAGRSLSMVPVLLLNQSWLTFSPDRGHPLFERFKALRLRECSWEYKEQKVLLEALHEKTEEEAFVATYTVIKNIETGALTSYCVWSEGVVTLLPEADEIAFVGSNGSVLGRCEWGRVFAELGDMMTALPMAPKRFRVEGFPPPETLARLLAAG